MPLGGGAAEIVPGAGSRNNAAARGLGIWSGRSAVTLHRILATSVDRGKGSAPFRQVGLGGQSPPNVGALNNCPATQGAHSPCHVSRSCVVFSLQPSRLPLSAVIQPTRTVRPPSRASQQVARSEWGAISRFRSRRREFCRAVTNGIAMMHPSRGKPARYSGCAM
jgi:hypothetical protein